MDGVKEGAGTCTQFTRPFQGEHVRLVWCGHMRKTGCAGTCLVNLEPVQVACLASSSLVQRKCSTHVLHRQRTVLGTRGCLLKLGVPQVYSTSPGGCDAPISGHQHVLPSFVQNDTHTQSETSLLLAVAVPDSASPERLSYACVGKLQTQWRLRTYLSLPWQPLVDILGATIYTLDPTNTRVSSCHGVPRRLCAGVVVTPGQRTWCLGEWDREATWQARACHCTPLPDLDRAVSGVLIRCCHSCVRSYVGSSAEQTQHGTRVFQGRECVRNHRTQIRGAVSSSQQQRTCMNGCVTFEARGLTAALECVCRPGWPMSGCSSTLVVSTDHVSHQPRPFTSSSLGCRVRQSASVCAHLQQAG